MSSLGVDRPMALRVGSIARSLGCPAPQLGGVIHDALTLMHAGGVKGAGQLRNQGRGGPDADMMTMLCSAVAAIRMPPGATQGVDGGVDSVSVASGPGPKEGGGGAGGAGQYEQYAKEHKLLLEEPVPRLCQEIMQALGP